MPNNYLSTLYKNPFIAIGAVILATAFLLFVQGRVFWCGGGDYLPWSFNINSLHNSQHLLDPYTFTHVLHGVAYYWILSLIFKKMPLAWQLALAVSIAASWELLENSTWVIERYRAATISFNYYGDSVLNSVSDILSCVIGFYIAHRLRLTLSLVFFVLVEAILLLTIRDSLLVNIVMLIYPIEAIKTWQAGNVTKRDHKDRARFYFQPLLCAIEVSRSTTSLRDVGWSNVSVHLKASSKTRK